MSPKMQRILRVAVPILVLVAGFVVTRSIDDEQPSGDEVATATSEATSAAPTDTAIASTNPADEPGSSASAGDGCVDGDVDTIPVGDLPDEAITTLQLIATDGPFPYDQDGATFQNREGHLPAHERGYYHEYTVETPGEADRGARRVISGDHHELYYTRDHYKTFVEIRPPE